MNWLIFIAFLNGFALFSSANFLQLFFHEEFAIATESPSSITPEVNTLEKIQKRGKLRIGVKDNLSPLGFRDRSGNLVGLEIDIARELAKELNIPVELVPVQNRDRLSTLQNNQIDVAIAQITVTTNRSRLIDFSLPYYTDSTVAIGKRDITTQEIKQTSAIGALKNSAAIAAIQSQFPKAAIIGANSYAEGLAALQNGQIAAFVGDRINLTQWLTENPEFSVVGQPLAVHSFAIAMPRGLQHLDLREKVMAIVEKWRKNDWLKERANFWGL
ncbi:transporter substrate-binding domain-containing protein [Pseudanabaena mucicola]|uniref:Transporter substrate-binding domain-containing protein n=1 Tax=Pseudanabaena mucicola FACHB-723 TaxID=2692860 RepID=A0ABR7ZX14_9CYAN|nr:transporter substrate-binding domain-containing protein [Pseudanabaena mucicola]MBD2188082.1 transporter substrate-binding domain-containing protein [Pseudanabaena mucicola FACHB-723]